MSTCQPSDSPAGVVAAPAACACAAAAAIVPVPSSDPNAFPLPSDAAHAPTGPWFVSAVPPNPLPPLDLSTLCKPDDEVQLHYLSDVPQFIPEVAEVLWREWPDVYTDYFNVQSLEAVQAQLRELYMQKDKLGLVLVATVGGKFACTATLTTDDVPASHPYHGTKPWLTCLYCVSEFRQRGLATLLFTTVVHLARRWGYRHLWLITEDQQKLYAKHGWRAIETLPVWSPRVFTVMRRDFLPLDAPAPLVPRAIVKPKQDFECTVAQKDREALDKQRQETLQQQQQPK